MVFNSITFLIFLAIVLTAYYRLKQRGQNILLVVASYIFYGWWDWRFVSLLLFTTLFDYWCALRIENEPNPARRKWLLAASMTVNLGVLCTFKYFNFFADSLVHVLAIFGMKATFPVLHVILPLGISFYTFLSMSYTIDVYRRELKAARNPLDFMLYVAFFPHLVAGPIVRASFLLPQCQRARVIIPAEVVNGIWQILMGYIKKVVIADRLSEVVNWGFSQPVPPFSNLNAWLIIYAFAFQIYGDFSGYSDIARGLAKLMGFELTTNFKAPYLVTNASAYWQNWHISLSTWLRDYLYIPLGGNRRGKVRTYLNLMITMLLGGLWHGAGAAFVLWGFFHGVLLSIHHLWQDFTGAKKPAADAVQAPAGIGSRLLKILLVIFFFHLTCIGWLLFRVGTLRPQFNPLTANVVVGGAVSSAPHAGQVQVVLGYLHAMFNPSLAGGLSPLALSVFLLGGLAMFFQWQFAKMDKFSTWQFHWQAIGTTLALALITGFGVFKGSQFIYFQF
jgi:D-alanyl-lipoteichoic acid acyltransferase DltB (MBOAT superfamily)